MDRLGRKDGRWREARMLDKTSDIAIAVDNWLAQFEAALAKPDDGALKDDKRSYWNRSRQSKKPE